MELEYDRITRFATMKLQFIYFFNSSIILDPIKARSKNSRICGSSIRTPLLMSCCVKAISIHIIGAVRHYPIRASVGNLSQLGTQIRIVSALLFEPTNEIGRSTSRTLFKKGINLLWGGWPISTPELLKKFSIENKNKIEISMV